MQRFSTWLKEYIDDTFKCVCVPMCRRKVKANERHDACFGLLHYIKGSRFVVDTYCGVSFFLHRDFQGHLLQMLMSQTWVFSKMLSKFKTN